MSAILGIFAGPYALFAKWGVIVLILVSAFGTGWVKGNQHGTLKLTEYQAKEAVASIKVIKGQDVVTEKKVTEYVAVVGKTKTITNTIEKEVTKYVDSKPLAMACMLDNRWIRLHDSAADGSIPTPEQGDDGASGEVTAAQTLSGITKNYAAAHRNEDRLTFCQGWVREQFKATNGTDLGY